MPRKRYSEEQIIRILREVESGKPVAEVARQYSVSELTPRAGVRGREQGGIQKPRVELGFY